MPFYLVFGAKGGLGSTFLEQPSLKEVSLGLDRHQADVTRASEVERALNEFRPEAVINATGYTAVDKAESEAGFAHAVNAEAVGLMARLCYKAKIPFVTYSTDFVFDGRSSHPYLESDPAQPLSVYGRTKREGELLALDYETSLVIRTSWLYSLRGKSFPRTILNRSKLGERLKIVDDQVSAPTFAEDLVSATLHLLNSNVRGLVHYSSSGETNWFEYANTAIDLYNEFSHSKLMKAEAIKTESLKLAATRPAYSTLNTAKAQQLGVEIRHWKEALKDFTQRLYSSEKQETL